MQEQKKGSCHMVDRGLTCGLTCTPDFQTAAGSTQLGSGAGIADGGQLNVCPACHISALWAPPGSRCAMGRLALGFLQAAVPW